MALIYVVDSNSWIDLAQLYPEQSFGQLWANMARLVRAERIISPYQVKTEIARGRDANLMEWCRQNKELFVNDVDLVPRAAAVVRRYPRLVNPNKSRDAADPFLIALAQRLDNRIDKPPM